MSDKPKSGAMLMRCEFCGAVRVILEWVSGLGWCCPICHTNVNGESR
jgi:hypothetical protein